MRCPHLHYVVRPFPQLISVGIYEVHPVGFVSAGGISETISESIPEALPRCDKHSRDIGICGKDEKLCAILTLHKFGPLGDL